MKRLLTLVMLLCGVWLLPSETSAQFSLGKLWGAVTGDDNQPSRYDKLADAAPAYSDLLGTWYYSSAKVDYFGDSMLAEYAISELDTIAQDLLKSYGVESGFFKVTIKRNGSIVGSMGDESLEGKFTYDKEDAEVELRVTLMDVDLTCDGYVEQYNNRLKVYVDAGDILDAYKRLGVNYNSSMLDLAREVVTRFDDIYIAISFSRS